MSTKDWKNEELRTILSEAWGFKFNTLQEFDEFNESGELQTEVDDEELDERRTPHVSAKYKDEKDDDSTAKNAPPPPRVVNKGKMEEAEDEGETLDEAEDEELDEAAKPDYIDIDGDGDKEESMKDAAADKKDKKEKNESADPLKEAIANLLRKHLKG